MTAAEVEAALWWHVYGGETGEVEGWDEAMWVLMIIGETDTPPEEMPTEPGGSPWPMTLLASFDHDPTEEERLALTPDDFSDQPAQRVTSELRSAGGRVA